jgi:hypothetical protein
MAANDPPTPEDVRAMRLAALEACKDGIGFFAQAMRELGTCTAEKRDRASRTLGLASLDQAKLSAAKAEGCAAAMLALMGLPLPAYKAEPAQPTTDPETTPETTFCDDCGEPIAWKAGTFQAYERLPFNVASANKGESAILCATCDKKRHAPALVATFQAEAWINDYAVPVDAEGPTEWDPRPYLDAEWPALLPEVLADCAEGDEWADSDDVLKEDPNAPEWVRDWRGPFTITVRLKEA